MSSKSFRAPLTAALFAAAATVALLASPALAATPKLTGMVKEVFRLSGFDKLIPGFENADAAFQKL